MVCRDVHSLVFEAYPIARSGLTGDSDIGIPDRQRRFKLDIAGDEKDYSSGPLGIDGVSKAAWPAVIEVGHFNNPPAATALREGAEALGAGKGWNDRRGIRLGSWALIFAAVPRNRAAESKRARLKAPKADHNRECDDMERTHIAILHSTTG